MRVFISYRMREHLEFVPQVAAALRAEGILVKYDAEMLSRDQKSAGSGLPLTTGVHFTLWSNILACDAVVVLTGSNVPAPKSWPDLADVFLVAVMRGPHMNSIPSEALSGFLFDLPVTEWYKKFYNFDIGKQPSETWQEWEIRVTQFFGLSLVRVHLVHSPSEPSVSREHGAQIIKIATLDEDIRHSLIPYLHSLPTKRNKPQPLPEYRRLFKVSRRIMKISAAISDAIPPWR